MNADVKYIREDKNLLKNFFYACVCYKGNKTLQSVFTSMIHQCYDVHQIDILITKRELSGFGEEVYVDLTISIRLNNMYNKRHVQANGEYTNLISVLEPLNDYWLHEAFELGCKGCLYWTSASGLVHMDRLGNVFKLCPNVLGNPSMEGCYKVGLNNRIRFVSLKREQIPIGSPSFLARTVGDSYTVFLDFFTCSIPYCMVEYVNDSRDCSTNPLDKLRTKNTFLMELRKGWLSYGFAYVMQDKEEFRGVLFSIKAIEYM